MTAALIVAGGRGERIGGEAPKQYQMVGGRPVIGWTLEAFLRHPAISAVQVVIRPQDRARYAALAAQHAKLRDPVMGGSSRQDSVRAGLAALSGSDRVLIHDAVRPFIDAPLITRVIAALDTAEAVLPGLLVADTLQRVSAGGVIEATVDRTSLYAAQTPQGFRFEPIRRAHERAAEAGEAFTDDAALARWAGMEVHVVEGERANTKLTTPDDMRAADALLSERALRALPDIRTGTGYDVHAFGPGDHVTLGGVRIPHGRALQGHSDADVALHALTDAILGALADGDIGVHFPPSDERWKGASSDRFLRFACDRVAARGGMIAHLDLAIIAEEPRLSRHRDAICARVAAICGVTIDRVGLKATTNERMGFIGRREGIAAMATATIRLPAGGGR
jgi:2-C-methyl-D-erythritol 4-phosphate cytidylyltransferase/2-C-methyl-D-erythritol 2,4-cyclodiphosphate synthase